MLHHEYLHSVDARDRLLTQIEADAAGANLAALRLTALPILIRIADDLLNTDLGEQAAVDQLDRVVGLIGTLSASGRARVRQWTFTFGDVVVADADVADAGLGARTWPSGVMLARLIDQGRVHLPGDGEVRVLELGAGTGLAGIAAAAVSARAGRRLRLTLSDRDAGVLANLGRNLERNRHLWRGHHDQEDQVDIVVRALDWSEDSNRVDAGGPFDVVLAADFCYDRNAARPVCRYTAAMLRPGGRFYAVVPVRERFEVELAEFATTAPSWGLTLVESETVALDPASSTDTARFFSFNYCDPDQSQ